MDKRNLTTVRLSNDQTVNNEGRVFQRNQRVDCFRSAWAHAHYWAIFSLSMNRSICWAVLSLILGENLKSIDSSFHSSSLSCAHWLERMKRLIDEILRLVPWSSTGHCSIQPTHRWESNKRNDLVMPLDSKIHRVTFKHSRMPAKFFRNLHTCWSTVSALMKLVAFILSRNDHLGIWTSKLIKLNSSILDHNRFEMDWYQRIKNWSRLFRPYAK